MSQITGKDDFVELLRPLAAALQDLDVDAPDAAARAEAIAAFDGEQVGAIRAAATANLDSDWLLPKEAGGVRFGRVAKDLCGFSVDCVWMNAPGPRHRHPNGEIDLCFRLTGAARFDGNPEG